MKTYRLLSTIIVSLIWLIPVADKAYAKKVKLSLKAPTENNRGKTKGSIATVNFTDLDTISIASVRDSIHFKGFDKPVNSMKETFYVINDSHYSIAGMSIEITYWDMSGRMLHKREEELKIDIPRGETRMISLPTIDNQKSLYYYRSRAPRKGGMSFNVEIGLIRLYQSPL